MNKEEIKKKIEELEKNFMYDEGDFISIGELKSELKGIEDTEQRIIKIIDELRKLSEESGYSGDIWINSNTLLSKIKGE
jgi:hypothetical protein